MALLGPAAAHFGLGQYARVDRVEVRYPDGTVRVPDDVRGDRVITVYRAPLRPREPRFREEAGSWTRGGTSPTLAVVQDGVGLVGSAALR